MHPDIYYPTKAIILDESFPSSSASDQLRYFALLKAQGWVLVADPFHSIHCPAFQIHDIDVEIVSNNLQFVLFGVSPRSVSHATLLWHCYVWCDEPAGNVEAIDLKPDKIASAMLHNLLQSSISTIPHYRLSIYVLLSNVRMDIGTSIPCWQTSYDSLPVHLSICLSNVWLWLIQKQLYPLIRN